MEWISTKDKLPPKDTTVFICGSEKDGKKVNLYYAESDFDGKKFGYPYYGQDMTDNFDNVTHWMLPIAPNQ